MLIRTYGAALQGVEGIRVTVEVDAGPGLPSFQIVGQGDRVVSESRDRIRSAFRQSGLEFPPGRVTVNLAPTDVPKAGAGLDLPIAVAIAATRGGVETGALARTLFVGELGLDGELRGVRGMLALVSSGLPDLAEAVVPRSSLSGAAVCPRVRTRGARGLAEVVDFLRGGETLETWSGPAPPEEPPPEADLADVCGQEGARRALEIAAAGGHNLLLVGPPGSGKTLLARRLPGLLPDLDFDSALEATRIHGVAGSLGSRPLLRRPPFQAPHHSISDAGLLGGGRPLRPGEISLAHRGILFLDELPEFRRSALEALRQPLEEGAIRIVRAHGAVRLPARFQWVAAKNPCPCGYLGDESRECACDDGQIRRYRAKLSGPLLDRIDLHVAVPSVAWRTRLTSRPAAEDTNTVRERVEAARPLQARRYRGTRLALNADLTPRAVREHCAPDGEGLRLLERAVERLGLSLRGIDRVLRVARTIADLDRSERVASPHVAEAIAYRDTEAGTAVAARRQGSLT
jgi:magnesium chelatase family protein